jgi:hypothetical protein
VPGPVAAHEPAAPATSGRASAETESPAVDPAATSLQLTGSIFAGGRALPPGVRQEMEDRYGDRFDDVVVHSSPVAAASAARIGARAYSVGSHVVFAPGLYQPGSSAGMALLAHELEHVAQASPAARNAAPGSALPIVPDVPYVRSKDPNQPMAIRRQEMSRAEVQQSSLFEPPKRANRSVNVKEHFSLPPNATIDQMRAVMSAIDGIRPVPNVSGIFSLTYNGEIFEVSDAQREIIREGARKSLKRAVSQGLDRASGASAAYWDLERTNAEYLLTSSAVKVWREIWSLGSFNNPREAVEVSVNQISKATHEAGIALRAGDQFAVALDHAAEVDRLSFQLESLSSAYRRELIEGGESIAAVLTFVRNASFATVAVLGIVISGGAALGLAPGAIGTGVGGLTIGQTVTAVSVGAPIIARFGEAGVKLANGEEVDWRRLAFDTGRDILLAKLGGRISSGIGGKLAARPEANSLLRQGLTRLATGAASSAEEVAFSQALEQTYRRLNGQEVSVDQALSALGESLSSPEGWAFTVLGAATHTAGARKQATPSAAKPPKRVDPVPDPGPVNGPPTQKPQFGPPAPQTTAASATPQPKIDPPSPGPTPGPPAPQLKAKAVEPTAGDDVPAPQPKAKAAEPTAGDDVPALQPKAKAAEPSAGDDALAPKPGVKPLAATLKETAQTDASDAAHADSPAASKSEGKKAPSSKEKKKSGEDTSGDLPARPQLGANEQQSATLGVLLGKPMTTQLPHSPNAKLSAARQAQLAQAHQNGTELRNQLEAHWSNALPAGGTKTADQRASELFAQMTALKSQGKTPKKGWNDWMRKKLYNQWRKRFWKNVAKDPELLSKLESDVGIYYMPKHDPSFKRTFAIKAKNPDGSTSWVGIDLDHSVGHAQSVDAALASGNYKELVKTVESSNLQLTTPRENSVVLEGLRKPRDGVDWSNSGSLQRPPANAAHPDTPLTDDDMAGFDEAFLP